MSDKIKNPLTGRPILINGPAFKKLVKDGIINSKGEPINKKSSTKKSSTKKSLTKKSSTKKSSTKKSSTNKTSLTINNLTIRRLCRCAGISRMGEDTYDEIRKCFDEVCNLFLKKLFDSEKKITENDVIKLIKSCKISLWECGKTLIVTSTFNKILDTYTKKYINYNIDNQVKLIIQIGIEYSIINLLAVSNFKTLDDKRITLFVKDIKSAKQLTKTSCGYSRYEYSEPDKEYIYDTEEILKRIILKKTSKRKTKPKK